MECYRNIVAVADDNPARFIAKIDPVRLSGNEGMALVSIFHGGVNNINKDNNKVYFLHHNDSGDANQSISDAEVITIPEGNYTTSHSVVMQISLMIRARAGRRDAFNPSMDRHRETITISMAGARLFVKEAKDSPWSLLGVDEDKFSSFSIPYVNYFYSSCPAFVYASIIENSYINGKLSRNLAVIPIRKSYQWSLYQPQHLNYVPISTKEFSSILIEIRDLKGKYVAFNPARKTIVTLRIAPINSINSTP